MSSRRASRFRFAASALTLAVGTALTSLPAQAVDYTWTGGAGFWNDASRWTLLGVPGANDSASIHFTGTGAVVMTDPITLRELRMYGGVLGGPVTMDILGDFHFEAGRLGASTAMGGGTTTVQGQTWINGATHLGMDYTQTLNLRGNTTWSAGNGILAVNPSYSAGSAQFGTSTLVIGSGTRFEDLGAASATGEKSLGYYGGVVRNEGSYVRDGLGTTFATHFNNEGSIELRSGSLAFVSQGFNTNSSSGSIQVASGATLSLGWMDMTGGTLDNQGLVVLAQGRVNIAATASIGGVWRMDGNTQVATISGNHTLSALTINAGRLAVAGDLTLGSLDFNGGELGHGWSLTPGRTFVNGATTLNGTQLLQLQYGQSLWLVGDSTWSAGNGRIVTANGYYQGQQYVPATMLHIFMGSTFTDQGAASASGWKELGHRGNVVNNGTYVRQGEGGTLAYGFTNNGVVQVNAGTFAVDARWEGQGRIEIASGAVFMAAERGFSNYGWLTGAGTVRPYSHATTDALVNQWVLAPGSTEAAGTLTIDGALRMGEDAMLLIDLFGTSADRLVVVDAVTWDGELALSGVLPTLDDDGSFSFVIASYGQRLANSSFDRVTWNGVATNAFTLEYGEHELTLRVSAVPEPATWALLLGGVGALVWRRRSVA